VFVLTGVTLSVAAVVAVDNRGIYPLATFTGPAGLQCAMWSSLGDTAAYCFGAIPGLNHPTNQVYAGDNQKAHFDQTTPPATDKLNGKPLASGQKVILGAGGTLMGGDQITCGVRELVIACMVSGTASSSTRKKAGRFEREARSRKVHPMRVNATTPRRFSEIRTSLCDNTYRKTLQIDCHEVGSTTQVAAGNTVWSLVNFR
jgi:hypothetical protein